LRHSKGLPQATLNFYAKTTEEGRRRATGAIVQFLGQEKTPEALVNGVVGATMP
jgi:hypothetical protein